MRAPDESAGINYDSTEKSTDWIATAGERCIDVTLSQGQSSTMLFYHEYSSIDVLACVMIR